MGDLFTDFFRHQYDAPEYFICVLILWLSVFVLFNAARLAVPVAAKFDLINDKKWLEIMSWVQGKADIFGFAALVGCGLLIPIDAYVTYFGDRKMSSEPGEWGPIGDFFGGLLNPILAFASFIALLYTIRIQSKELELTRKEFEKSVKAQSDLAAETREQVNLFGMQNVLNTFNSYYGVLERTIDKDGASIASLSLASKISYSQYVTYSGDMLADVTYQEEHHRALICNEIDGLRRMTSISCVNTDSVHTLFEVLSFLYGQLKHNGNDQNDALQSHNSVLYGCARLSIMQMNAHMILNICVYYLLLNKEHESRRNLVVEFKVLDVLFSKFEGNKGLCAAIYFMIFYDLKQDEHSLLFGYKHYIEKVRFINKNDA